MELLDVLDENGNKTGEVEERSEVYRKGLWHRSSHIWIINDNNELLVQRRNPYKATFPNLWAISVAGHVDSGETSLDTAIRELKEEVNLDVNPNELEFLFTIKRETPYKDSFLRVFDDVYLLRKNIDCEQTKLQVEELTDIKYVYYEYLEDIFKEGDKDYVPYTEEHKKLFEILKDRNLEII
ncbi:MAG: NUDIX domain-containing protein [Bacilli bacterium]|nr:NUDIX domain-containing protein [Bacilli bacterium]